MMPSDKTLRWSAFGFGIFFALVVILGYIPQLNQGMDHVSMQRMGEHKMLGLYMIGAADDVTHGLTAVILLTRRSPFRGSLSSRVDSVWMVLRYGRKYLSGDGIYPE